MVRKVSRSAKHIYRRRVSKSPCRGKKLKSCVKTRGCKKAKGAKRTYCRRRSNTRRNKKASFRVTYRV